MKKVCILILSYIIIFTSTSNSQVESVPIDNSVYTFLKEMKVKGILSFIREDDPVLSRFEVKALLDTIAQHNKELSSTETKLLQKYQAEFSDKIDYETATQLFNPKKDFFSELDQMFTNKVKYLYAVKDSQNNIYFEGLGHFYHGQRFTPTPTNNADLYDIGFRIRGTVFNHLGYNLTVLKGGATGNKDIAQTFAPWLLYNFKWIEASENIGNYDFTYGYVKYHTEPVKDMNIMLELGREETTLGYGYGDKLVLSDHHPALDFLKFNFDYEMINFSSMHGSTTGYFSLDRSQRYTKYIAFNRLKLKFNNLFDVGIGETMIYSGRGIELAYLSPVNFYKFSEMSLQDRDNGNIYFDLQTKFIKNLEFTGTFFLDENILSNLVDLERFTNKTAYQVGAFWYQPFSINDLSFIVEYTKIRPYVYTHVNIENNYTAFGANLGHRIGPNADEIMARTNYNLNEWVRFSLEYRFQRNGKNVYDANGNLIKNVGGDIALSHGQIVINKEAPFLDGERINYNFIIAGVRLEPARGFIFDISYNYLNQKNLSKHLNSDLGYALFKFVLEY